MEGYEYWFVTHSQHLLAGLALLMSLAFSLAAWRRWQSLLQLEGVESSVSHLLFKPVLSTLVQVDSKSEDDLKAQLSKAGYLDPAAVNRYVMAQKISSFFFISLVILLFALGLPAFYAAILGLGGWVFGRILPSIYLDIQISNRRERINRSFPAAIDLVVLCLEVGLSIEAAFLRVSEEMQALEPYLAEEARLVLNEMSTGLLFPVAFRRMAMRLGIEEIVVLSRLIEQANAVGASMSQTLRDYSSQSFERRIAKLEEQAGKVAAMLSLPLTACLMPSVIVVLLGPTLLQVFSGKGP